MSDVFCQHIRSFEKAFARRTRRTTQMKNSYSVSALIGEGLRASLDPCAS